MSRNWSRRELLASLLGVGTSAALLDCGFAAPAAELGGALLGPDVKRGHRLRDLSAMLSSRPDATRHVEVAIVGAGPAGLTAAWHLAQRGVQDLAVIDLESSVGGTSRAGQSETSAFPWGAHYLPMPMPHNRALLAFLDDMGVLDGVDANGTAQGAEEYLVRDPEERLHIHGYWQAGLFPHTGATPSDLAQLQEFHAIVSRYAALQDGRGRRAFAIPVATGSDDAALQELERETAEHWLVRHGLTSPRLRWFCEYACRDDYGLTLAQTSAWALLFYFAARTPMGGTDTMPRLAWPEGNAALVRHLCQPLSGKLWTDRLVVNIRTVFDGETPAAQHAELRLWDGKRDTLERVVAKRVICAVPHFIAKRIVEPLRHNSAQPAAFSYSPWLVANLHLADRPREQSVAAAWDNVIYQSPSLGYVSATHQLSRHRGPTIWTYYYPLTDDDPRQGRERLLGADWQLWRDVITRDLSRAHPDLGKHLSRLDVWRWGHGMVSPRTGQVFHSSRREARQPQGAVHFAHSDLSGVALFEEAFYHGHRAADEVFQALRQNASSAAKSRQ